jgi:hypothetical protein
MKNLIYYLLFIYACVSVFSIFYFNGTGDADDSVTHYLFARYAPYHPKLYFDHWAKPVYVLLASPFAQLGFVGLKFFNTLISLITIFVTYKIALVLKIKNAILAAVFVMLAPLWYILTFSGLTEPLFALFMALSILLCLNRRYTSAFILISFLPYVRSEGLIIMGVFGVYALYQKLWKKTPLLLLGSLVYALAGYFVYEDFLWVFTKIPYANLKGAYGSGPLFHFVEQLVNVIGVPIYILFWIGFISLAIKSFRKHIEVEQTILIWFSFLAFFTAHSLFWYLGIFNSMGLKRVLLGIVPLLAIISLYGYNAVTEDALKNKEKLKWALQTILIIYVTLFPFTPNPSAIQWKKDMMLSPEQELAIEVANFMKTNKNYPLLYNHHYISVALGLDDFDESKHIKLSLEHINRMKSGDFMIWEENYAKAESDISKTELDKREDLLMVHTYIRYESKVTYTVYQKK